MQVLGLALYGPLAASTRHRLTQYENGLAEYGITLDTHSLLSDRYLARRFDRQGLPYWDMIRSGFDRLKLLLQQKNYDCAILYCELFPFIPGFVEQHMLNIPYIYDLDDAFFLKYGRSGHGLLPRPLQDKADLLIGRAAAVTAGNDYLADYARALNSNTTVLPTVIDKERYLQARPESSDIFTIGWIGSPSTAAYLEQVYEALSVLGQEAPVRFVAVGAGEVTVPNVMVVNMPWSEQTEIDTLCSFDVGIMPLPDNEWTRGKCAFKLIQYMACGIPSIASPVGANPMVLSDNCGLYATDTQEWVEAFRTIRDDRELRDSLARNSRERALSTYTVSENLPALADTLQSLIKT